MNWDDYISPRVYDIDGTALNSDLFPLNAPDGITFIPKYTANIFTNILIISCIEILSLINRRK